jgi:hypothetical protein
VTSDQKQKTLLGVLGVLILGMGSTWWFVFRDTGPKIDQTAGTQTKEKKKREVAASTDKKGKRKRTKVEAKTEKRERKTREVTERETKAKAKRTKGKKKRKKKEDRQPPAASLPPSERWFEELELEQFDASGFRPPVFT